MGNFGSYVRYLITGKRKYKILMVGLDSAGKTTILFRLKGNESVSTIPTLGFNIEEISFGSAELQVLDLGGQTSFRSLWTHFATSSIQSLIFVVDSADKERLDEARMELHRLFSAKALSNAILLVLANKQDLPGSYRAGDVKKFLILGDSTCRHRKVGIFETIATTGSGLQPAVDWLLEQLQQK